VINDWVAAQLRPGEHEATLMEAALGTFGGAYPKKWWRFLDAGLGGPLRGKYDAFMQKQRGARPPKIRWDQLEAALTQEMQTHKHLDTADPDQAPEYQLLAPIATRGILQEPHVERYLDQLKALTQNGYRADSRPRPALGHVGIERAIREDEHINQMFTQEKLIPVQQDDWLYTHSGMRIPDDDVFRLSYREGIMDRIKEHSAFGRY